VGQSASGGTHLPRLEIVKKDIIYLPMRNGTPTDTFGRLAKRVYGRRLCTRFRHFNREVGGGEGG